MILTDSSAPDTGPWGGLSGQSKSDSTYIKNMASAASRDNAMELPLFTSDTLSAPPASSYHQPGANPNFSNDYTNLDSGALSPSNFAAARKFDKIGDKHTILRNCSSEDEFVFEQWRLASDRRECREKGLNEAHSGKSTSSDSTSKFPTVSSGMSAFAANYYQLQIGSTPGVRLSLADAYIWGPRKYRAVADDNRVRIEFLLEGSSMQELKRDSGMDCFASVERELGERLRGMLDEGLSEGIRQQFREKLKKRLKQRKDASEVGDKSQAVAEAYVDNVLNPGCNTDLKSVAGEKQMGAGTRMRQKRDPNLLEEGNDMIDGVTGFGAADKSLDSETGRGAEEEWRDFIGQNFPTVQLQIVGIRDVDETLPSNAADPYADNRYCDGGDVLGVQQAKIAVRCTMTLKASEVLGQQCFPMIFEGASEIYKKELEGEDLALPAWVYCMAGFLGFTFCFMVYAWVTAIRRHMQES